MDIDDDGFMLWFPVGKYLWGIFLLRKRGFS